MPRITGQISRRSPAIVDDLRFAKTQTNKPIKMDVPGPMTVIDSTLDEFYKDEAAMAMDVAAAINEELRDFQAAGCDVLEIDDGDDAVSRKSFRLRRQGARPLPRRALPSPPSFISATAIPAAPARSMNTNTQNC